MPKAAIMKHEPRTLPMEHRGEERVDSPVESFIPVMKSVTKNMSTEAPKPVMAKAKP